MSSTSASTVRAPLRHALALMPTGGGLRDADWDGRHRLLTWTMIVSTIGLSVVGLIHGRLDVEWLATVVLILLLTAAALLLPPRRLPSSAVALGLTAVCADLVMMFDGLTEAHFSFFVVIGLLALYRDWAPFLTTVVATVVHHALAGWLMGTMTFDHPDARRAPLLWAAVHGLAVLLVAATQVVAWSTTEAEERRADADLSEARSQFTAAFEEAPIAMAMLTPEGVVLRLNPSFREWVGLAHPPPPGTTLYDLPILPLRPPRMFDRLNAGADVIREEHSYRHRDGGPVIHVDVHVNAIRDDAGRLRLVVAHFMDITEKREQQEALRRQVREDSLTGLLTRSAFEEGLAELVQQRSGQVAVIYLDVDRFKTINDSRGHGAGDHLLRTLGERLRALAPRDSRVARLGGDEFAIALPGPLDRAVTLGATIVRSCDEPVEIVGGHLSVTMSVGVAAAVPGEPAEAALQSADLAMYAAKQRGRNQIRIFDEAMRDHTRRRVDAERALRDALEIDPERSLPVWFQPIVSLETREAVGAEALVRLRAPGGPLVSPADFIPIAEETGLIVPLGQHVLRTSLLHLQEWGESLPYVSVNVSPQQLAEVGFVPMLTAELEASGLADHSRLVLEITETSMLQSSLDLRHRLDAIKALGVRLALDDFGTGYSSLTWLQSVPADIVKLDRSFVAGLAHDPDKAAIISAVLWLARSLDMTVIAEGVEEEEDAAALAAAHCPAAQGYLFSRPVPADDFEPLLSGPLSTATPARPATTAPTVEPALLIHPRPAEAAPAPAAAVPGPERPGVRN